MNENEHDVDILDLNYPLLVKYKDAAPGSFAHSKVIAEILEKVGNALGLNSRKLKTAGLYHDIGKMITPMLYSENQPDEDNPHDKLEPWVSFALISGHVAHTVQILSADPKFESDVIQICSQHHGSTLAKFFFDKSEGEDENLFRYPSRRPQTFESALLMLCDHLEARTRSEINSGRITSTEGISELVEVVFNHLVDDNQFDDVAIPSFKALRKLKVILKEELTELFKNHKRIDYTEESNKDHK